MSAIDLKGSDLVVFIVAQEHHGWLVPYDKNRYQIGGKCFRIMGFGSFPQYFVLQCLIPVCNRYCRCGVIVLE